MRKEEVVRDEGGVVDVEGLESGALAGSDWEIGASILVVGALFPLFAAALPASPEKISYKTKTHPPILITKPSIGLMCPVSPA